jgi:hypothetical protein
MNGLDPLGEAGDLDLAGHVEQQDKSVLVTEVGLHRRFKVDWGI